MKQGIQLDVVYTTHGSAIHLEPFSVSGTVLSNARRPTRGADSLVRFSAHTNSTKFGVYTSANSRRKEHSSSVDTPYPGFQTCE